MNCVICQKPTHGKCDDVPICEDCYCDRGDEFEAWIKEHRPEWIKEQRS